MKNAVHVYHLRAKAMGSGQSRLGRDVPWQAQAKEPKTHPLVCSKETVGSLQPSHIIYACIWL